MSTGEILFLAHRIPFPPDRGDKIRSHHLLKALAALAPVHVATLADDARDWDQEDELRAISASYCLQRRSKPLALAGVEAVLKGVPVSRTAFHHPALDRYVAQVLRDRPIDTIVGYSSQMGQYIPTTFGGRVLFDFVDVDSAKFEAYADQGHGPMAWVNAREGRLLRAEEARLARLADVSLLVSPEEAALFAARLAPEDRVSCDVRGMRNGIDSQFFDPAVVSPQPELLALPGPRLIFTGQMDYAPNVAAALRVAQRILPRLRERFADVSFHVVGRNPTDELKALHGQNGVHVWGGVPDIRTWLAGAHLALVPLDIARGIQNKVLEAMAMSLPVVLTSGAATGIGAEDGHDLLIADSDDDLVEAASKVLDQAELAAAYGAAARRFVVGQMSWEATLAPLAGLIGREDAKARHAA